MFNDGKAFLKQRIIIRCILTNFSAFIRQKAGIPDTLSGSIHLKNSPEEALKYTREVVADYLEAGGLSPAEMGGKRILEIGPGDNFAVALTLISMGAERVVCLDKFRPARDREYEFRLYSLLRQGLKGEERERFDHAVELKNGAFRLNPERVRYITGTGMEEAERVLKGENFDLIISRAVLRYIHRIDRAFLSADKLLSEGGMMIHFIDMRDSGTFNFRNSPFHPLTFLTIPEPLWILMSSHSARPNRRRMGYYARMMERLGYSYRVGIRRVFGSTERLKDTPSSLKKGIHYTEDSIRLIRGIRPRFACEFRELQDEELLPSGIVLCARKSHHRTANGKNI